MNGWRNEALSGCQPQNLQIIAQAIFLERNDHVVICEGFELVGDVVAERVVMGDEDTEPENSLYAMKIKGAALFILSLIHI